MAMPDAKDPHGKPIDDPVLKGNLRQAIDDLRVQEEAGSAPPLESLEASLDDLEPLGKERNR